VRFREMPFSPSVLQRRLLDLDREEAGRCIL
jgi:hypothetical protein